MIDKINNAIIKKYLSHCSELNVFDRERIKYALKMLLDEGEKILAMTCLFILLGQIKAFLLSFLVLMSLRIFIGGIHFSTRFRCFWFSTIFFLVTVILSQLLTINKCVGLYIGGLSLTNIVLCAPLPSKHRELVSERGKIILRNRAVKVIVIWLMCYICLDTRISNIIIWTVIMQQVEILYYKIFMKGAIKKDE